MAILKPYFCIILILNDTMSMNRYRNKNKKVEIAFGGFFYIIFI